MTGPYPRHVEASRQRPRRRWARRLLVTAIIFLIVLIGLLVIADRAAVGITERAIADRLRQQAVGRQLVVSQPDVTVGGIPFLTQVLAGRYKSISVRAEGLGVPVDGESVQLTEVEVEARNVAASLDALRSGQGDVVAKTLTVTGVIPYHSVARLIDQPDAQLGERDGELVMTVPVKLLGQEFTVQGTADISVEGRTVRIRFDHLTADNLPRSSAAQALLDQYADKMSVDVPLPELPFDFDVQQVRVLPEGLAVTAVADDVPLSSM